MYEAFAILEVASKLPLDISVIAKQGGNIIAGTKTGALLIYTPNKDGKRKYEVQMCRTFAKKAVVQLLSIDLHHLLLCLSDGLVTAHDTRELNYPVKCTLLKAKGASLFTSYVDQKDGTLYIGVAVKRKLQLFKWTDREFEEIALDLAFPDVIQAVSWCDERVAVAVRDEYFMVTVFERSHSQSHNTDTVGTIRALFTMGNRPIEPLIVSMPDRRMIGFCRDDSTIFVDFDGKSLSREYIDIRWSEVPIAVAYDPPYLVALLPKNIEIRSIKPSVCVQVVQLPKVRMLAGGISGHVYAAAAHDLWEMTTAPNLKQNIQQLVKEKQYEMAIQLAERLEEEDVERSRSIQEIKHLYAFNLFCQRKFTEAFAMFSEIGSEVLYVIGLFPDLLPDEIRNNIVYPDTLPPRMNTEELRNGLQGLAGFLSETRTRIAYLIAMQPRLRDKKELSAAETTQLLSVEQLQQNRNLLQIVDTTLLRCYVETNDMLVASLLRLPDNSCNVPATEKILRERQKFYELFLLYERKGMHSEALDLLKSQSKNEKSSLKGLERTVHYLQNLGNSRLDLIFKYSSWVLQESDLEGLKIFTEDCDEVRGLDRERVLHYLLSECPSAVIPYLEHIILQWNDARPKLHNTLAELYLEKVKALLRDYLQSLPAGHQVLPAGKEPGQLSEYRSKLIFFLGMSFHYSPELLLVQIPHDALFEERALLLGRMKRHEQAIAIYTNILHDYKAAENYCNTYYDKTNPDDAQVFLILLKMYAHPSDNSILGFLHSNVAKPKPNIPQALKVIKDYAHRIDTVQGVEFLSADTKLDELWVALEAVLQSTTNRRRNIELHKGLYYASMLRTKSNCSKGEGVKVNIASTSGCAHCGKKISNSAFARFPDGTLVHYYCFKQNNGQPPPKRDGR